MVMCYFSWCQFTRTHGEEDVIKFLLVGNLLLEDEQVES